MIVDASVVIDAVADPGIRGEAARTALANHPVGEPLGAPGHFAFEVLSGLRAAANRPGHPLTHADIAPALADAQAFEIDIEATPWIDVPRAWELAQTSLRFADGIYIATAERHSTTLLTSDARVERSGASMGCEISTVVPADPPSADSGE